MNTLNSNPNYQAPTSGRDQIIMTLCRDVAGFNASNEPIFTLDKSTSIGKMTTLIHADGSETCQFEARQ